MTQELSKIDSLLREQVFKEEGNSAEQLNPYLYGKGRGYFKDSIELQFCGWCLVLNPNGTWCWFATDGG